MASGYWSPLLIASNDGPALTAAARASALPTSAKYSFGPNPLAIPQVLRLRAHGRISCVVTTPGTARFDLSYGGTVFADSGAINLNVVAKTTLPWWLEVDIYARAIGATANFFSFFRFQSEAVVGAAVATAGGNGSIISAVAGGPLTAPAVGANTDITAAGAFDFSFTQTVATGSFTVHGLILEAASLATP